MPLSALLAIERTGVVGRKEHFEKLLIGDLTRVEFNLCDLCVSSLLTAHLPVRGIFYVSPRIP